MAAGIGAGGFPLVFGLNTFGDTTNDDGGRRVSHAQTIRDVVEEGALAERAGIDFFGIGEHHTDDMPLSAADVALAAIAARTSRIRLGSSVTVLSSDEPVRVFQRFSTLNAVSSGRAEVILGRGSSIDSFPLFGHDLNDYEILFEEKTALFAELLQGGPVTWEGTTRAPLVKQDVVPHLEDGTLTTWIGVGGSPESVVRAARHGFSLMIAIIGGSPTRFAEFSALYGRALDALRAGAAAGRHPHPRARRGDRRGGLRAVLAAVPGHVRQAGDRARVRAADRGVPPPGDRQGRVARRRLARDRRGEDRVHHWGFSARASSTSSTGWGRCRTPP